MPICPKVRFAEERPPVPFHSPEDGGSEGSRWGLTSGRRRDLRSTPNYVDSRVPRSERPGPTWVEATFRASLDPKWPVGTTVGLATQATFTPLRWLTRDRRKIPLEKRAALAQAL